ncbi:MAG TPA: hypothetical protein VHU21_07865 [Paraburkholderia sp.]|jgi:hypothetical protein|nr:hypothetical protein [Paraburkholderia sp.]
MSNGCPQGSRFYFDQGERVAGLEWLTCSNAFVATLPRLSVYTYKCGVRCCRDPVMQSMLAATVSMKSGGQRKRHHVHACCEVCVRRQALFYDGSTVQVRDVQQQRDDMAAMQRHSEVVQEH